MGCTLSKGCHTTVIDVICWIRGDFILLRLVVHVVLAPVTHAILPVIQLVPGLWIPVLLITVFPPTC